MDDSTDRHAWAHVLAYLRDHLEDEEFRRWFGETAYASDSGDQIVVWVSSEAVRRYIQLHFLDRIDRALAAIGRGNASVRFVVTGPDEEEEEAD